MTTKKPGSFEGKAITAIITVLSIALVAVMFAALVMPYIKPPWEEATGTYVAIHRGCCMQGEAR